MRKILLFLFIAVVSGMRANTITVTGAAGHPGDEVTVTVAMTGSDAVTALELQLPLGEWLTFVDGSCTLNGERSDGHSVTAKAVGDVLKVYAYSLELKPFKGTSGELLTLRLKLGNAPGNFTLTPTVIASDANGTTLPTEATSGTATILCPALRVVTEQIDFGHVPIRSSYEGQLTLENYGNEPLEITNITTSDGEVDPSPALPTGGGGGIVTIAPGARENVTITYSPLKRVPFEATLSIESDAVNAKIYNRWQTAKVVADPFSVNELHVQGASGASDTEVEIALRMNNMEPIVGAQVSFTLPAALKYVDGSATMTDRSDNHTILATTAPLPTGEGQGERLSLFIYSSDNKPLKGDDGDFCTFRLSLEGQSGWYYLSPENVILSNTAMENMTSATSGDYAQIQSPTISGNASLSFGQQDATKPLTATYTVYNSGQAPLTLEKATFLANGFRVVTPLPLTIATSQNADIEVEYTAPQAGEFTTTMNLYCNDPATRVKAVAVSGTAFSPNELTLNGTYERGDYRLHVSLSNHAPVTAVQFTLAVNPAMGQQGTVTLTPTARLASHTANIYPMENNTWKVLIFSMTNASIGGNEGELLSILVPSDDNTQDVTFTLTDIVLSSPDGRNLLSPVTTLPQNYTFEGRTVLLGDTNEDGVVDIADVVNLIAFINSNGGEMEGFNRQVADVNSDGEIDIADVVGIIELINNE